MRAGHEEPFARLRRRADELVARQQAAAHKLQELARQRAAADAERHAAAVECSRRVAALGVLRSKYATARHALLARRRDVALLRRVVTARSSRREAAFRGEATLAPLVAEVKRLATRYTEAQEAALALQVERHDDQG